MSASARSAAGAGAIRSGGGLVGAGGSEIEGMTGSFRSISIRAVGSTSTSSSGAAGFSM